METIIRSTHRRATWLAVVLGAIGLAAPAWAQSGEAPLAPPPTSTSWPEFPRAGTPVTSSPSLPAFSGFGMAENAPKAGSFPQPGASANSVADAALAPAGTRVWTVTPELPPPDAPPSPPSPTEAQRTPKEFGNGWKNFVNKKVIGRETPAASLAAPRNASWVPRPEMSWHGYEAYDQSHPAAATQPAPSASNAADLAPFMKYSHLWKPSTITSAYTQGYAQSNPLPAAPPPPPAPYAIPAPDPVRPPVIQPTTFRLPPAPTEPSRPNVIYMPPPEPTGPRVPLPVREKLSNLCVGKCRNLVVEMPSPTRLRIGFLVKDQVEAEMLTNLLGSLPELAAYKVDFEVQIGQ